MWDIEQLKIKKKKMFPKTKIQNFESEAPHTKTFNINWNFMAKIYVYNLLQAFYTIGHTIYWLWCRVIGFFVNFEF